MKFKIDENLPIEVAGLLNNTGFNAISVKDQQLQGEPDSRVSTICQKEGRVLISLDLDFTDIRAYPPKKYPGLIVLRMNRQDKYCVLNLISRLIPLFTSEIVEHHLWVVDEKKIRIRE